jgi:hypothetical protein
MTAPGTYETSHVDRMHQHMHAPHDPTDAHNQTCPKSLTPTPGSQPQPNPSPDSPTAYP